MSYLNIPLVEACEILDKEIIKNTVCLGVDVAQNKTGFCIIRTTDSLFLVEEFYGIELKKKESLHKKILTYKSFCEDIRSDLPSFKNYTKVLVLEDCFFGQSIWTTKVLSKFETVNFLVLNSWADKVFEPVLPLRARKGVGFTKDKASKLPIKEQIQNWIEDKFYLEITDSDLSDAFILALFGLIK